MSDPDPFVKCPPLPWAVISEIDDLTDRLCGYEEMFRARQLAVEHGAGYVAQAIDWTCPFLRGEGAIFGGCSLNHGTVSLRFCAASSHYDRATLSFRRLHCRHD